MQTAATPDVTPPSPAVERLPNTLQDAEVFAAAAESLRQTLGREPTDDNIVSLLVASQVPLLSFVNLHDETSLVGKAVRSQAFQEAARTQQLVYDEVHGNFEQAARAWEGRGVRSICFKSAGIPPSYPYTSENFDILFKPEDETAAREVLTDLGYVLLANCDEPNKWLYRLFVAGKSVSAIHLHTRVGWGQGYMLEPEIFARARQSVDDPVTWIPGPEDVVLINTAHAFVENKAFGLHDLLKVRRAILDGADWRVVEDVALERGWLSALQFSLAMMARLERRLFPNPVIPGERFEPSVAGDEAMSQQLARASSLAAEMPFFTSWKLVKRLFFDKILHDRREPAGTKPVLFFLTLARGVKSQVDARPQNSGLFALSGIDGSGKTAQAEALSDAFGVCHLRRRIIWGRLGATPGMHRLSRLWSNDLSAAGEPSAAASPHSIANSPDRRRLPRMIWAALSAADFAAWLLRIRWQLCRGDIVIADRYLCDFDVELTAKLPSPSGFRSALLMTLRVMAPRPRKAFLLDVDAATARERAAPDGEEFDREAAVRLYRDRADAYDLTVVDATQPFETASAVVERHALRSYFNRYRMIGNLLFFQNPIQLNRPVRKQGMAAPEPVEPVYVPSAPHIV